MYPKLDDGPPSAVQKVQFDEAPHWDNVDLSTAEALYPLLPKLKEMLQVDDVLYSAKRRRKKAWYISEILFGEVQILRRCTSNCAKG
jgi:hypothetical protein